MVLRLTALAAALGVAGGLVAATPAAATEDAVVQTDAGAIRGVVTATNRSFLGVPYAQPPVGELRWRAPQPQRPWSGVRDTTQPGPLCAQLPSLLGGTPTGSTDEDCLYLNVHAPADARAGDDLPVMVWLHGGAFAYGGGSLYDPSELARRANVIVVTVNYRLGPFGFLALPGLAGEDPALNFGLQDQQAALRWTARNIDRFGGDRDRITLFGESAGAVSVCAHLVSPRTKGMFHRAIMQSGACTFAPPGSTPPADKFARSKEFAAAVGCPDGPGQIACLRNKSVTDLMPEGDNALLNLDLPWQPVVDGQVLPGDPAELISAGRFHRMPILIGTNRDEGRLLTYLAYDLRGETLTAQAPSSRR